MKSVGLDKLEGSVCQTVEGGGSGDAEITCHLWSDVRTRAGERGVRRAAQANGAQQTRPTAPKADSSKVHGARTTTTMHAAYRFQDAHVHRAVRLQSATPYTVVANDSKASSSTSACAHEGCEQAAEVNVDNSRTSGRAYGCAAMWPCGPGMG